MDTSRSSGGAAVVAPPESRQDLIRSALLTKKARVGEKVIVGSLMGSATLSVLITFGIVLSLLFPTIEFFKHVGLGEFLFGTEWTVSFGGKFDWNDKEYGALALVSATLLTTVIALVIAVPLGLGAAIYLSEYASRRVRKIAKPMLEVLAGIPTVVYGFLALTIITPIIKPIFGITGIYSVLSAGLVMGFMIVPTVASLSEDALTAVPLALRQGSYALGANRMRTTLRVVVPAAFSGIIAAIVLAISRAVGETMIVAIAAGSQAVFILDPRDGAQTMTGFIAQVATGDAPTGSPVYYALFAIGSLLFVITMIINLISIRLVRKYRNVY